MVTNAVPIVAGFVLLGETLPHWTRTVLQIAALACLVVSTVALRQRQTQRRQVRSQPLADGEAQ